VLAGQHARELGLFQLRAQRVRGRAGLAQRVGVRRLRGQLDQELGLLELLLGGGEEADAALQLALLAQRALGALAVVPQLGVRRSLLQLLEPRLLRREVKDASAAPRASRAARAALRAARAA